MLFASNRYGEALDEADVGEKSSAMELTVSQKTDTCNLGIAIFGKPLPLFNSSIRNSSIWFPDESGFLYEP